MGKLGVVPLLIGSSRLYRDARKGGLVGFGLGLMTKHSAPFILHLERVRYIHLAISLYTSSQAVRIPNFIAIPGG